MPRDVVALVSVEDFVSAVRVYGDRVHDLLRRDGIPPHEAVELCETHALALLDAVVTAPETVVDLAGWWFARTLEVTGSGDLATAPGEPDESVSLLAGTEGEAAVRAALATLPANERAAVILRDAYDLPPQAVAVAVRRSVDSTSALTAQGRLQLVAEYDGRAVPSLLGHTGRVTVDVPTLSRLAEGSLESPRAAPLRRHLANCPPCEDMLETLEKGRRLAAGLPIIALPEAAREDMLEAVEARALAVLPSHDLVLRAVDEDHDPKPAVSPLLAVIVVALALLLGIGLAVITRPQSIATPSSASVPTVATPETTAFALPPTGATQPGSTDATTDPSTRASDSASSSPGDDQDATTAPPPVQVSSSAPAPRAHLALSPSSGPGGTEIDISGTDWVPAGRVIISISGGGSVATRADDTGQISATLTAPGPLPGRHTVTATGGGKAAQATFTTTLA